MPDKYGFTHEQHWGDTFNRCIECDEYPWGVRVSERERARHHQKHMNQRKHTLEQERLANLRLARKNKQQIAKENA
jgi:hypothetical protein